jgi:exosortase A
MDSDSLRSMPGEIAGMRTVSPRWVPALVLLALVLAAIGVVFYDTAESIVAIWQRSDTFAHGYLIIPISLWLVWEKRSGLRTMAPQPAFLPLLLMLPVGFAWFLGSLVDVLVVQQFAFVGVLILAVWCVLGTPLARYLAFPLAFLFLGVPVGEGLIYPMMNFTADFTVGMLRLTGIPVYRDGTFFSIPSGDWSVVEACSGVRYLIASVTLGVLYAYLTYTRLWKRLLFVAFSVVVPIIANGFRAYMIVMIAHLSDMKLAVGVDHLIYGWVFFGIIITIMFFIGALWRDPPEELPEASRLEPNPAGARNSLLAAVMAVLVAAIWPALAWSLSQSNVQEQPVSLQAPHAVSGWKQETVSRWDWRPDVSGEDGDSYTFYKDEDNAVVGLYLGVYRSQRQGAELLNSQNVMARQPTPLERNLMWSDAEQTKRTIKFQGNEMVVNQSRLTSRRGERLLVWNWYRIGDHYTANPYLGKLLEAISYLFAQRRDGSLIVIATDYQEKEGPAVIRLQAFADAMAPTIDAELNRALRITP